MNQQSYKTVLEQAPPPADPQARLRARRAALEEFARVHAPANFTEKPGNGATVTTLPGRVRASTSNGRAFALAASISVAVMGIAITWPMLRENPELLEPQRASPEVLPTGETLRKPATAEAAPVAPSDTKQEAVFRSAPPKMKSAVRHVDERPEAMREFRGEAPPIVLDNGGAVEVDHFSNSITADLSQLVTGGHATASPEEPASRQAVHEGVDEMVVTSRSSHDTRVAPHKSIAKAAPGTGIEFRRLRAANSPVAAPPSQAAAEYSGRDRFESFATNAVKQVSEAPVSTFSADVDTASYGFVRKQLNQGLLPQKDAVRVEEMINYFDYAWPAAESRETPFRPTVVVTDSPWGKGRKLVHIGIKGYELPARQRPDANLVLLIDVSGSMTAPDKLPLVKDSMRLLVDNLKPDDTVGIVVYAGAAGLVLPPTRIGEKEKILEALESLTPGGSTAGAEGIRLAYELAEKNFRKSGVNRILLATDGDFNVGIDSTNELKGFVERKREKGVFLSVLGFGQGNYRDELAQALAQNGNGVAAYIDTLNEAHKVLVQEAGGSLFTIAKDVKLQVEFNPATVAEYRLVGYETRALKREDFNNDAVDAGDVGSGHTVTAIYEISPVGSNARMLDESRYAPRLEAPLTKGAANEYGFLKIRYKMPDGNKSRLIEQPISIESGRVPDTIARDVAFSTAVAGFAQLLRGGTYTGSLSYDDVARQALSARGEDPFGYRNEFVQLVRKAQTSR